MQKRFEAEPGVPCDHAVVWAGAGAKGHGVLSRTPPNSPAYVDDSQWCGDAGARFQQPGYADPWSAVVVQRQIPHNDHECGGGYSRWKDIGSAHWREDSTRDNGGTFCYLR